MLADEIVKYAAKSLLIYSDFLFMKTNNSEIEIEL